MTQKDKELLLKDLCARLPYGVKGQAKGMIKFFADEEISEEPWTLTNINVRLNTYGVDTQTGIPLFNRRTGICNFKPYLFSLSSMTEEQKREFEDILIKLNLKAISDEIGSEVIASYEIDFYNKNHFDYRGLIEKSLALDATGLNIY